MKYLDVAEQLKTEIKKKLISVKSPSNDGLLITIHQNTSKNNVRFKFCDFQSNGNILALANNDAQVYLVDFVMMKCWCLKKFNSCTCIKLSEYTEEQILVGKQNGALEIINIDTGAILSKLFGHDDPVFSISFTQGNVCLSASKTRSVIWDLHSFSKLHVLSLEKECSLKCVDFVPISNHILTCYQDDIIQLWQNSTFQSLKQFPSSNWGNSSIRSITFSRNGKIMVVSGYLPILRVFQLDIWKLLKIIKLPENITSIKKIQLIPQHFDGGCNKLLAILSGNGIIYFYDMQKNVLLSELKSKCEITKFNMSSSNVSYISCLLRTGEVEVYDINFYIMKNEITVVEKAQQLNFKEEKKPKLKKLSKKSDLATKNQMNSVLEINKLKAIIKEYQEFPEAYRATIWEKVLKLPNNIQQYNSIVDHVTLVAFHELDKQFPLEDKVAIRCLRHVLNNIVTWCPFFAHVSFLPCFLFPFVKVFHKKSVACFELCCTIIINWCQHWFEYYPLPPVNILAIIDNILMEYDADLLKFFSENNIKPLIYSWSILETAFSEVLTANEWLIFWDHIFINEPSFLICAVVAYNILQKKHLIILNNEAEFYQFFHSQRQLDVKKLINKTYFILNNTGQKNHPRQYMDKFTCLNCGAYPIFNEYPQDVVKFQADHVSFLENQLKDINDLKEDIIKEQAKQSFYNYFEIQNEEDRRMIEVEKACIQKIKYYQEALKMQQDELKAMRMELLNQEQKIIDKTQNSLKRNKENADIEAMQILMDGMDIGQTINETELTKLQENYQQQHLRLRRKENKFDKDKKPNRVFSPELTKNLVSARKDTTELKEEIEKDKTNLNSPRKANIAITISAMNNLIEKIKVELRREHDSTNCDSVKENLKVHQLEKETKALQKEISQLLHLLTENCKIKKPSSQSRVDNFNEIGAADPNKTVRFHTSKH